MRSMQIRRICYTCGTPSWGLHTSLGAHTAGDGTAGDGTAGGGVAGGEGDDYQDDDDGGLGDDRSSKSIAIGNLLLNSTLAAAATFTDEASMPSSEPSTPQIASHPPHPRVISTSYIRLSAVPGSYEEGEKQMLR
jgi:hypothetical protein